MGHENFEPNQEIPAENGENNGGDITIEGEETVIPEIPETQDEGVVGDPEELFKGVPEAPLEEEEA